LQPSPGRHTAHHLCSHRHFSFLTKFADVSHLLHKQHHFDRSAIFAFRRTVIAWELGLQSFASTQRPTARMASRPYRRIYPRRIGRLSTALPGGAEKIVRTRSRVSLEASSCSWRSSSRVADQQRWSRASGGRSGVGAVTFQLHSSSRTTDLCLRFRKVARGLSDRCGVSLSSGGPARGRSPFLPLRNVQCGRSGLQPHFSTPARMEYS
jgi:hypothetical protein